MSSYYHFQAHAAAQPTPGPVSHSHHGGRNRRAPRLSVSQNSQKQFRGVRSMKEINESLALSTFRLRFEAAQSFDLEDDMEFCPNLLSDAELGYISASERSSLASSSPESSPTQRPTTVAPAFSLNSSSPPFIPPAFLSQQSSGLKLHQPSATRARGSAIPIINPATGITMASPPPSVSPARMQQTLGRRW